MIRLTLVLTAVLAAASAPALAQRAELSGERQGAYVSTDAPLIAIHNVRAATGDYSVASGGSTITARSSRIETMRQMKTHEVRDAPSSAVLSSVASFPLPVRVGENAWICRHSEGMGP